MSQIKVLSTLTCGGIGKDPASILSPCSVRRVELLPAKHKRGDNKRGWCAGLSKTYIVHLRQCARSTEHAHEAITNETSLQQTRNFIQLKQAKVCTSPRCLYSP